MTQVFTGHCMLYGPSEKYVNRIDDVMVSMLESSAVYRWFETRSSQTKDHKISIYCVSAKHASLSSKSKDCGIRIMCPSGATCLPADCCLN